MAGLKIQYYKTLDEESSKLKSRYVNEKTMHIIKTVTDKEECCISSICEATQDKLFILDYRNHKVKLMDSTYKVVNEIKLDGKPYSMCSIDSRQVAVTAVESERIWNEDGSKVKYTLNRHMIYFISKTNDKLEKCRTLQLKGKTMCRGIAHHQNDQEQGKLYVTSGTALYSIDNWKDGVPKLRPLYMDTEGEATVTSCAVSKDGTKVYVVNQRDNKLVTLSSLTGEEKFTLGGKHLKNVNWGYSKWHAMPGLHVTDTGHILVCGGKIDAIVIIDSNGEKIISELNTARHGVSRPRSVYFSKKTSSLIVGVWKNDIFFAYPSFEQEFLTKPPP